MSRPKSAINAPFTPVDLYVYIYIYYMSVMIFDLKQCSIAANCTKMFAEIFTHAPTWTSSKHLSVWQYISAYHSLYHKISFRTRPFWGFERCGKQFCLCLLGAFDYIYVAMGVNKLRIIKVPKTN